MLISFTENVAQYYFSLPFMTKEMKLCLKRVSSGTYKTSC